MGGCAYVRVRQGGGGGGGEGAVGEWKKRRGGTNKKIIEDISQAEAGLLRHTELIKE